MNNGQWSMATGLVIYGAFQEIRRNKKGFGCSEQVFPYHQCAWGCDDRRNDDVNISIMIYSRSLYHNSNRDFPMEKNNGFSNIRFRISDRLSEEAIVLTCKHHSFDI